MTINRKIEIFLQTEMSSFCLARRRIGAMKNASMPA
jgi:hypothetical protein